MMGSPYILDLDAIQSKIAFGLKIAHREISSGNNRVILPMQVRGQLFTLYLMYYDDESDLIHSEGLQGCGVQKWPYVVLRQFRLLHCALARFLSELSSFRQIHVVVSRGGGIHHFCDSQFTAIHNLTLTIRFNSIHVFWVLRGESDSQGRFKIILALGSTIQV